MAQTPFVVNPVLTAVALTYRNPKLIADQVLPRVPVDAPVFMYSKFTPEDAFTVPNTLVGRKGDVPEIDWSATQQTAAVEDQGLEEPIPNRDIQTARALGATNIDPQRRSTELLTDLVALAREVRVASLVTSTSNYASGNFATLSGSGQWSDPTSDPVNAILSALDGMLVRPNIGVIGRAVYTKLRQHPKVIAAVFSQGGNAATGGVASRQAIADLLELDEVLVGEGWVNTAKKGQTSSLSRVWGKDAAFLYENPLVASASDSVVTFGFTAEWGSKVAGSFDDNEIGLRGGVRVRVGESVKELVVCNDCGYLFKAAVA
jgi:hypothetical protein